jgi:hypothetical protein
MIKDITVGEVRNTVRTLGSLTQEQRLMFACLLAEARRNARADGLSCAGAHHIDKIGEALVAIDEWLCKPVSKGARKNMRIHEISEKLHFDGRRICQPDASGAIWWEFNADALLFAAGIVEENKGI